jgi:hypothetical protein
MTNAMNAQPLHPHRALWVLAAVALVGVLSYGGYLLQGMQVGSGSSAESSNNNMVKPVTAKGLIQNLNPINPATTTTANTATQNELVTKSKPINNSGSSASSVTSTQQSLIDSTKPLH